MTNIRTQEGKIESDPQRRRDEWKRHWRDLLGGEGQEDGGGRFEDVGHEERSWPEEELPDDWEVAEIIRHLKDGKVGERQAFTAAP
eukprot:11035308-Prorocentrum_lima.AAC.1